MNFDVQNVLRLGSLAWYLALSVKVEVDVFLTFAAQADTFDRFVAEFRIGQQFQFRVFLQERSQRPDPYEVRLLGSVRVARRDVLPRLIPRQRRSDDCLSGCSLGGRIGTGEVGFLPVKEFRQLVSSSRPLTAASARSRASSPRATPVIQTSENTHASIVRVEFIGGFLSHSSGGHIDELTN